MSLVKDAEMSGDLCEVTMMQSTNVPRIHALNPVLQEREYLYGKLHVFGGCHGMKVTVEASLTSNQTKLNKTFLLRQRGRRFGASDSRTLRYEENFSCLSFSSACPSLKPAFPKTTTNYNIDARFTYPVHRCCERPGY
ncbi:hypothetical protein CBL_13401 [Carabus blaptoides fortunei]